MFEQQVKTNANQQVKLVDLVTAETPVNIVEIRFRLVAMTQELGKIETIDGSPLEFSGFPVDTVLFIFPYHVSTCIHTFFSLLLFLMKISQHVCPHRTNF